MKRRLLAALLLSMLLGTGGVVFTQPGFAEDTTQAIESVQQLVAAKGKSTLSIVKHSDVVNAIVLLLAEGLILAGLFNIVTKKYYSYNFSYTQALTQKVPDKEKDRRFSWDDVL